VLVEEHQHAFGVEIGAGQRERTRASLRFSFSRFNSSVEVEKALEILPKVIGKLRRIAVAA
jgi:cysteine sulfinate desulfinase/cysteine desulfurase-like protein